MSPIRMFSVKLLEPTMMVPPVLEELEDEELPLEVDGDSPQEANKTANALIMMNINFIFFVIGLLLNLAPGKGATTFHLSERDGQSRSTVVRHFSIICVPAL